MKQFISKHHREYYKDWVYLDTINKMDYYIQGLPTEENPYPSMSIIYGSKPEEYISTTIPIQDMLAATESKTALAAYVQTWGDVYVSTWGSSYMMHMTALVRDYKTSLEK